MLEDVDWLLTVAVDVDWPPIHLREGLIRREVRQKSASAMHFSINCSSSNHYYLDLKVVAMDSERPLPRHIYLYWLRDKLRVVVRVALGKEFFLSSILREVSWEEKKAPLCFEFVTCM